MKKLLLTAILFSVTLTQANASTCKNEYSEFGRDIFVNKVCPVMTDPDWRGMIFSNAHTKIEKMIKKYCVNTPKVLCQDDIHKDANDMIDSAKAYIKSKPNIDKLTNFDAYLTPIQTYLATNSGAPAIDLDTRRDRRADTIQVILRNNEGRTMIDIEDVKDCNLQQSETASLTCLGELEYFIGEIYQRVRAISNRTHLEIVSMCLKDFEFGKCTYRQFVEKK